MSLKLPRNWEFNLKMDVAKIARCRSVMSGQELERPLKLGWLKKQRSIVKNWQHRYFVLKGQQLYYYKDEDDAKPQVGPGHQAGVGAQHRAGVGQGGEEELWGVPGEPPRAGQDPCVLMASSQGEMDEWVKSLRRALGSASGDTVAYEQRFGQPQVPVLVQKCAQFILERGRNEEGIFRLPGQDTVVKQLRDAFDAGERPSFHRDTDVHTVASLLKLYLRELPEPVVPWAQYEDFLLCGQALDAEEAKGREELLKQLSLLPRDNYNLLSYLCRFLHEIQLNSSVNKMSVDNLATVFGVNLIRPKIEDPATIMRGTPRVQKVMTVLISEHSTLFPACQEVPLSPPVPPSAKAVPVPRSSVGWGAAEDPAEIRGPMVRTPLGAGVAPGLHRHRPGAPSAGPGAPREDAEPKDTPGMWKAQPRKRTQTLPARKSALAEAAPAGKGSVEKRDVFARDFWKSGSRSALPDGHKRTLSHDLFKLLDLHRASNCDNAPPSPAESGDSSPSSGVSEQEFLPCPTPSPGPEPKGPASPATEVAKPEQEGRELELPKEMQAQKKDYEEQIQSLQKENYEVWAKVVRLNQELEREKKKSEELELKLLNVERLREDVERKNKMLEEQIKNFTK
ncbi:RHG25 protein, partial [Sakesphorus luctuosus]|nr:RHG25 protein [Sakesphorus luctuosus]